MGGRGWGVGGGVNMMLSRVDVSDSELQNKIIYCGSMMSFILLFIVPIYSASCCNVSTSVHACAIIMSYVLMHTCSDALSRLTVSILTFCEKSKAVENFKVKK